MLFFLHIPKTGGQTLATRIASGLPRDRVSILNRRPRGDADMAALYAAHDFVDGHIEENQFAGGKPPGMTMLTAVREPVARMVSSWRHILRAPDNRLTRVAQRMDPVAFFENWPELMFNGQARYLALAFGLRPPLADLDPNAEPWLLAALSRALAQCDIVVPTEKLDEFSLLWSLREGRAMPALERRVNEAPAETADARRLAEWLRAHPERYALDLLLWRLAQQRYEAWRRSLLPDPGEGSGGPEDDSCVFLRDGSSVRLGPGWHPRAEDMPDEPYWWAGPQRMSSLRIRRAAGEERLHFEIIALIVRPERIEVMRARDLAPLPLILDFDTAAGLYRAEVPLDGCEAGEEIVFATRRVPCGLELDANNPSTVRQSFAVRRIRLA